MIYPESSSNSSRSSSSASIIASLQSQLNHPDPTTAIHSTTGIHTQEQLEEMLSSKNQEGVERVEEGEWEQAERVFRECLEMLHQSREVVRKSRVSVEVEVVLMNNLAMNYQRSQQPLKAAACIQHNIALLTRQMHSPALTATADTLAQFQGKRKAPAQVSTFLSLHSSSIDVLLYFCWQLGQYHLQLSGLNSQSQQHEQSLRNAQRALSFLKQLCRLCYELGSIIPGTNYGKVLLRELMGSRQTFSNTSELERLREEYGELSGGDLDNDQVYHESYRMLAGEEREYIRNADIHSLFDLRGLSVGSGVLGRDEICFSYFHHMQKVLFMLGSYFAISVELEELESMSSHYYENSTYSINECPKNASLAEMAYLSALTMGMRYLPEKVALTTYLEQQYRATYADSNEEQGRGATTINTNGINTNTTINVNANEEREREEVMDISIKALTEKYKNFLVEKDIDLELEECNQSREEQDSEEPPIEQKQSKKLVELLKPEDPRKLLKPEDPRKGPQNKYFNDLASIDSYEMANSQSTQQPQQSLTRSEGHIQFTHRGRKNNNVKVSKPITEQENEREEWASSQNHTKRLEFIRPVEGRKKKSSKSIKKREKSSKKVGSKGSKMKSEKGGSRSKEERGKKKDGQHPFSHFALVECKSEKLIRKNKSKSRSPLKKNMTVSSQEGGFFGLSASRKQQPASEHFKAAKLYSPNASVKDNNLSLKFNKVKSKVVGIKHESGHSKARLQLLGGEKGEEKGGKRSKNKSVSSRNKSSKNKSLSTRKPQSKKSKNELKPSVKIYTSATFSLKRQ